MITLENIPMYRLFIYIAALYMIFTLTSCNSSHKALTKKKQIMPNPELAMGEKLYERHCVSCHLRDEELDMPLASTIQPRPRNFLKEGFLYGNNLEAIKTVIRDGVKNKPMPGHKFRLKEKEITAIAKYIMFLRKNYAVIDENKDYALQWPYERSQTF